MNVLLVASSQEQDPILTGAFEEALTRRGWQVVGDVPLTYTKSFESADAQESEQQTRADVDEAAFDAEWKNVKYVFLISEQAPLTGVAKGI